MQGRARPRQGARRPARSGAAQVETSAYRLAPRPPEPRPGSSRLDASGESEEVAHGCRELVGVALVRLLPKMCSGLVEELVHQCVGKLGDVRLDLGIDIAKMAKRPAKLVLADLLGLPPELGDERLELELSVAAAEDADVLLDERLDLRHLGETRRDGVVEAGAEVVDVEQLDARYVRCLPL